MSAQERKIPGERAVHGGNLLKTGLIGCDLLLGVRFPPLDDAIRGQACVANLVKQRAVANAQSTRRLLAVPVTILQNLQNDFPFQLADRLAGQLFERNLPVDWNFRVEE